MTKEVAGCAASLAVERYQLSDEILLDILKEQLSKKHFLFPWEEVLQQEADK